MGWCSGTQIFDPVAGAIMKTVLPDETKYDLLMVLIKALFAHDWDCADDSIYWRYPLVQRAMRALGEVTDYEDWQP